MMRARLAAVRARYARSSRATRLGYVWVLLAVIWFAGRSLV